MPIPGTDLTTSAGGIPFYSVDPAGAAVNYTLPARQITPFFKYHDECKADSHY